MSEGARIRLVAVSAALVALVFTLVAVIVVLTRDSEPAQPSAKGVATVSDHVVRATDVVRLQRNDVELVVEQGVTKGLRVKDPELAKTLGLDEGDVVTAMTGKPVTREFDLYDLILKASLMNATTMYIEVARKDPTKPSLLRWKLDGDLREARYGSRQGSNPFSPSYTPPSHLSPSYPSPSPIDPFATPRPSTPDALDALLDTIEQVDDTHVRVPSKVIDAVLANPMALAKGARVVPAMRNGQPDGFKLYAIRPSSGYARLGFQNGDTIHSINGVELTSADKALEVYTKLRDATNLSFDITRRGQPVELTIEITK